MPFFIHPLNKLKPDAFQIHGSNEFNLHYPTEVIRLVHQPASHRRAVGQAVQRSRPEPLENVGEERRVAVDEELVVAAQIDPCHLKTNFAFKQEIDIFSSE